MAQHIGIERIDERGKIIETSEINFAFFNRVLCEVENYKVKYPLLSYIDEYGNTYFNKLQIPDLIEELSRLGLENKIIKENLDVEGLVSFLKKNDTHQYVKFIGD